MSVYIDKKYVSLISRRLDRFTQKSDYLWNFRCPICGDSQKNKLKSRGYIYRRKSDLCYSCHNCGVSISFGNFLKSLDRPLYDEYIMERFKEETGGNVAKPDFSHVKTNASIRDRLTKKTVINLPTIESLPEEHEAKQYLLNRKVPRKTFSELYYASDFKEFVVENIPNYEKKLVEKEKRIVIPFLDENNILLGWQGRALDKNAIRYITVKLNDENKKAFGLNRVDYGKTIYVVEGPLDSLFLENSIAVMDASLYNVTTIVGEGNYVLVFDNEPRNAEVCKHIAKAIDMGYKVCIWPKSISEKDINDMVLAGMLASEIQAIIDKHTYDGLMAKLEFETWRKS